MPGRNLPGLQVERITDAFYLVYQDGAEVARLHHLLGFWIVDEVMYLSQVSALQAIYEGLA